MQLCYQSVRSSQFLCISSSKVLLEFTLTYSTSVGGNDVELTNILNQCVFQWAVFNWEQVEVTEVTSAFNGKYAWAEGYDFEALGRGCAGQLSRTASLIASSDFSNSLDAVLSAAQAKLADGSVLTSSDSCVVCADRVVQTRGKIYWTGLAILYFGKKSSRNY
jgi:hypothetical protein